MQFKIRTLLLGLTIISIYACEPEALPGDTPENQYIETIGDSGNEHNPIDDEKDD